MTSREVCCGLALMLVASCGSGQRERSSEPAEAGTRPVSDASSTSPARTLDAAAGDREVDASMTTELDADGGEPVRLSPQQLRDPETCKGCHPAHYREWSSSMHAYAAVDPVFIAMNKRGQRETDGALGDFCVKCHAPMAVVDGLTRDGLNLGTLPDQKRGVSCYFCHNVVAVEADHNGELRIAGDAVMRGPLEDPVESGAHGSLFTETFDHNKTQRNAMCGGCHDIVMPNGVELERTYKEFRHGVYGQQPNESAPTLETCASCHMPGRMGRAAVLPAAAPPRMVHEHLWPGVDVALTDFPNPEVMRSAVEDCQLGIASIAFFTLEVRPPNEFRFKLETSAGHNVPSGAAQDRRMWLELSAYDADGKLIEQASSGLIGDTEIEDKPADDPRRDPQLWMFRDRIFDARGEPAHMFWDAAPSDEHPQGYEANTLAVSRDTLGFGTHAIEKVFQVSGPDGMGTPARVTARLRLRPIGMDVLQDLVASGDLDAAVLERMPTFSFGAQLQWTQEDGFMNPIMAEAKNGCLEYRCMLEPDALPCQ